MTKKELTAKIKKILNTNPKYKELPAYETGILLDLFRYYYDHSNHTKFSFVWDESVLVRYIFIGYNKRESYFSPGFQIMFSNGIKESPSFYKAIASLTKEEVVNLSLKL